QFQPLRVFVEASALIGERRTITDVRQLHTELEKDIRRLAQIREQSKSTARHAAELQKRRVEGQKRGTALNRLKQYVDAGLPSLLEARTQHNGKLTELARIAIPEPERTELLRVSADLFCNDKDLRELDVALQTHLAAKRLELQAFE